MNKDEICDTISKLKVDLVDCLNKTKEGALRVTLVNSPLHYLNLEDISSIFQVCELILNGQYQPALAFMDKEMDRATRNSFGLPKLYDAIEEMLET